MQPGEGHDGLRGWLRPGKAWEEESKGETRGAAGGARGWRGQGQGRERLRASVCGGGAEELRQRTEAAGPNGCEGVRWDVGSSPGGCALLFSI